MQRNLLWAGPYLGEGRAIDAILRFVNAHTFEEGIHLVKRRAITSKAAEHYGFAVVGDPLKYFQLTTTQPVVIHKTNLGVHPDSFEPFLWEKVETLKGSELGAVARANVSYAEAYHLLFDNCEHFARFVVTGKKESTQVRNAVVLGLALGLAWLVSRSES